MTTYIAVTLINSILKAARTCDDTMAIFERMNKTHGIEVVPDGDPRAQDVAVSFMYPNGARASLTSNKN
jgi:hypothetical protein